MMVAKYAGAPFGSMKMDDVLTGTHSLLLKIHVMTGWKLPADELLDVLIDQFSRKLLESYPTVNEEEVLYAFRNTGEVKDWGKNFNLLLLDEVMRPFLQKRSELSKLAESASYKALPEPARITDEEFIESAYRMFKTFGDWTQIPLPCWKILKAKIVLTDEQKEVIRTMVKANFEHNHDALCKLMAVASYFETQYKQDAEKQLDA